jgi:hypothetical protein
MANVKARLRAAVSNVDLGIVLLVAAAVSVLDLLDVLKDGQSDQLILPVLAQGQEQAGPGGRPA